MRRHPENRPALAILPFLFAACLGDAPVSSLAAAAPAPELVVTDARGTPWPPEATPRRPRLVLRWAQGLPDARRAWILGDTKLVRETLATSAEAVKKSGELMASLEEAVLHAWTTEEDGKTTVVPVATMRPRARFFVVSATRASGASAWHTVLATELRVSDSPGAGARVVSSWPPSGMAGVPTNLELAVLGFDGWVDQIGTIGLVDDHEEDGNTRAIGLERWPCDALGLAGEDCALVFWQDPLSPLAAYRFVLDGDGMDTTGDAIDPWEGAFRTSASTDEAPPTWIPVACAADEEATAVGCVLASDTGALIRLVPSEPVRIHVDWGSERARATTATAPIDMLLEELAPASIYALAIEAVDLAGHSRVDTIALRTRGLVAEIAITEVQADPTGREPDQELIEVINYGAMSVDLTGFSVADDPGDEGDVVPGPATLAPGGIALFVSDRFDPEAADGGPVPPGIPLVRLGTSLGKGGLSNAGEMVVLRDAAGARVSTVPRAAPVGQGRCLVRDPTPAALRSRFGFTQAESTDCTPGRVLE